LNSNEKKLTKLQIAQTSQLGGLLLLLCGIWYGNVTYYYLAVLILFSGLVYYRMFQPIASVWFGLATILSNLVSKLLLSIIFYLLVTPIGLIRKFAGNQMLRSSFKKDQESVFKERNDKFEIEAMRRAF